MLVQQSELAELDGSLAMPSFFADPYPIYSRLRAQAPVYWSQTWGGWVLTRYADVTAVMRDWQRFSSAGRISYLLAPLPESVRSQAAALEQHYRVGIAHVDPPDHTRLRALLTPFFTPRRLAQLQPRIERVVEELLEVAGSRGRLDLIHDLAYPLPAMIVLEMIGAPVEDSDLFRGWALAINTLFAAGGRIAPASVEHGQRSLVEMRQYVRDLAEARRRHPQDDVISHLVMGQMQGEKLSEAELISTCVTLFVAGHETTTNLIGNGMLALLRQRDQWELLCAQPELAKSAVEELLRFDTPVQRGWRIAAQEVEIGGCRIAPGDLVLPMLGAANRDPDYFADPDRLDIRRDDNRHLGFGYGIHFCLGAPLARLEAPAALAALAWRFPKMQVDESQPLIWRRDVALRGVDSLPVKVRG